MAGVVLSSSGDKLAIHLLQSARGRLYVIVFLVGGLINPTTTRRLPASGYTLPRHPSLHPRFTPNDLKFSNSSRIALNCGRLRRLSWRSEAFSENIMAAKWVVFGVFGNVLGALASVTVYHQLHQQPLSAVSTADAASYTGAAAYDPTVLEPPPPPNPPIPHTFAIQLQNGGTPGASIQQNGAFFGFSIEMSVVDQVCESMFDCADVAS